MGVLGWTPQQQGYFQSFHNLVGALSQGFFIQPMLRRLGTRRAYEYGELRISRAQRVSAETSQLRRWCVAGALASTASYGIQALCVLAAGQIPMSGEPRSRSLLPGLGALRCPSA